MKTKNALTAPQTSPRQKAGGGCVQRLVRNPCDQNCPKCGSRDIHRKHRMPGDGVDKQGIDDELIKRPPFMEVNWPYGWKASKEHIGHHCRTCQYEWESSTLPNAKLSHGHPTTKKDTT